MRYPDMREASTPLNNARKHYASSVIADSLTVLFDINLTGAQLQRSLQTLYYAERNNDLSQVKSASREIGVRTYLLRGDVEEFLHLPPKEDGEKWDLLDPDTPTKFNKLRKSINKLPEDQHRKVLEALMENALTVNRLSKALYALHRSEREGDEFAIRDAYSGVVANSKKVKAVADALMRLPKEAKVTEG